MFADIAHRSLEQDTWYCDILFFSNKWLEEKENNLSSLKLHTYWLHEAWRQSFNCRANMSFEIAWENFSKEVTRRNWKPRPYIINIIKHLIAIGEGFFPGFTPATHNNEIAAPIRLIQKAYMESYKLKQLAPTLMYPHHLKAPDDPVYYSLYLPTLLEYAPQASSKRNIMSDMRELKMFMEILSSSTSNNKINYAFFHCDEDRFEEIRNSQEMPDEDKRLTHYPKKYGELEFANNSPFLRGCIRVSIKKTVAL